MVQGNALNSLRSGQILMAVLQSNKLLPSSDHCETADEGIRASFFNLLMHNQLDQYSRGARGEILKKKEVNPAINKYLQ